LVWVLTWRNNYVNTIYVLCGANDKRIRGYWWRGFYGSPPRDNIVVEGGTSEACETTSPREAVEDRYTFTAYCGCSQCCGEWAENRPTDENGNEIVLGASGEKLISGVSVASPLPFGTKITDEYNNTYVVCDRTSDWIKDKYDSKIIDVYFNTHADAIEFGKKVLNVKIYYQEEN
jgi:3D (Asp-Asp-Asp) domain-containing protein